MQTIIKSIADSLLLEHTELMNEFDVRSFKQTYGLFIESSAVIDPVTTTLMVSSIDKYTKFINESMEFLRSTSIDKTEVEDFFSKIYTSSLLDTMPLATVVFDTSIIEKIRPQYLEQIVIDMRVIIDRIMKGSISKNEVRRYCDGDYMNRFKKQLVKSNIPDTAGIKDITNFNNQSVVAVNGEYITNTVLPFIRSLPQISKELDTVANNTVSQITKVLEALSQNYKVANEMIANPEMSTSMAKDVQFYVYNVSRIAMECCAYITAMIIKRANSITSNVMSYEELYRKILSYHPEGATVLHESGTAFFRADDDSKIIHGILNQDSSILVDTATSLYEKEREYISLKLASATPTGLTNSVENMLNAYEYYGSIYQNIQTMIKRISNGTKILMVNIKDHDIIFDDICEKSGFSVELMTQYRNLISPITDTENYHTLIASASTPDDYTDILMSALKEIRDFVDISNVFTSSVTHCHNELVSAENTITGMINDELDGRETRKEVIQLLVNLRTDYRQLIVNITKALLERLTGLSSIITECNSNIYGDQYENEDVDDSIITEDTHDYTTDIMCGIINSYENVNKILFESMLIDYNVALTQKETGAIVVYEDGENDTSVKVEDNAPKSNDQNKTTTQTTQPTSNATANASSKSVKSIIADMKNVIMGIINKFRDKLKAQSDQNDPKNNLSWLKNNQDKILSRDLQNVKIWILPYSNVSPNTILNDINSLTRKVNMLTNDTLSAYKTKDQLSKFLFDFANGMNDGSLTARITHYYKTNKVPMKTVMLTGGQLKTSLSEMFDYCEKYYTGYAKNISDAIAKLSDATDTLANRLSVVKESVILEASSDVKVDTGAGKADGNITISAVQWLSSMIQMYSASVLNVIRDRNFDYLKVLNGLAGGSKQATTEDKPDTTKPDNTTDDDTKK